MAVNKSEQDDDFIFGDNTPAGDDNKGSGADDVQKNPPADPDKDADTDTDVVPDDEKKDKRNAGTGDGERKEKPAANAGDDDKGEEAAADDDSDADIFIDELSSKEPGKVSLKQIAKDFDLDLENDDEAEFKTKFSEKLDKSRQEFNLDNYSDEAKAVIKHLNDNGGDIDSFFSNPKIISMQSVLALDPEAKVRNVRIQEEIASGKTRADAVTSVDEELKSLGTRELKDIASDIDAQAKKLINDEVKKIVGDQEMRATQIRAQNEAKVKAEKINLKSFVEKQDNFLGLKLSPEAKKLILRDIDNGNFDKVVSSNPDQIKFSSYMFSKYGSKIMKKIDATMSEHNRKGYNAATRKQLDALHKTENEASRGRSGHSSQNRDLDTGSKPKWGNDDFE
jgi:hypothetical protein